MSILAILASCALTLQADVIVLKNGDRVTGNITKKDGGNLTVKSAQFGTVTIPWAQVESITTDEPVNVELQTGETVQGKLTLSSQSAQVGSRTITSADVKTVRNTAEQAAYERLLHPGWDELWAGTATIGWAGTAGNAQTSTFTIGFNANRTSRTDKITVYFNTIKASAFVSGAKQDTAQAIRGGYAYNRNLHPRLFLTAFNDWEYDRFQSLDLRLVIGGGAGFSVWKSDRGRLDLPFGGAWSRAKFDPYPEPKFTRNSAEIYWGDDFSLKLNSRTNITQTYRMFNNMSQSGEYRVNGDLAATTQIFKWLSWNISVSDRFLSNPAPGRKTNDLLYTTGFGVSFSR